MTPRTARYVEDEEDPMYQTIRSLKSTAPRPIDHAQTEQAGASADEQEDDVPPLPPRTDMDMSRKA